MTVDKLLRLAVSAGEFEWKKGEVMALLYPGLQPWSSVQ